MSKTPLRNLIQAASAQGILPADAVPLATSRPWPIVLLTALGAWLAAVPLMLAIGLLFGETLVHGAACYFVAAFALVAAKFILHAQPDQDFIEQLGVPVLLAGLGLLAFGLHRDASDARIANALLALLVPGIGWFVRQHWLRMVLGALACLPFMLMTCEAILIRHLNFWSATSFATLVWLVAMLCIDHSAPSGDNADKLLASESLSTGWIMATLAMLVYGAGSTFLSAAVLGFDYNMDGGARLSLDSFPRGLSCALAVVAMACRACSALLRRSDLAGCDVVADTRPWRTVADIVFLCKQQQVATCRDQRRRCGMDHRQLLLPARLALGHQGTGHDIHRRWVRLHRMA